LTKTIAVVVPNEISRDSRVLASLEAMASYDLLVLDWPRSIPRAVRPLNPHIMAHHAFPVPLKSTGGALVRLVLSLLFVGWAAIQILWRRPDAAYAHDFTAGLAAMIAQGLGGVPYVYDAHEHYVSTFSRRLPDWTRGVVSRLENLVLSRASSRVTVGDRLRQELERRVGHPVLVAGNWKDSEVYDIARARREETRIRLGLSSADFVVCYLGVLSEDRRVLQLVSATASLNGVRLVVGGYGPLKERAMDAVESVGGLWVGMLPHDEVPTITAACDAVAYILREGYPGGEYSIPNRLFDAIGARLPLIVRRGVGEISEFVERHDLGALCETDEVADIRNAIVELARKPTNTLRSRMEILSADFGCARRLAVIRRAVEISLEPARKQA